MAEYTDVPVLVVDDDESMRKVICWVLEDAGYAAQQAENGAQALAALRVAPDGMVVVLDLLMPLLSGWDVLEAVEAEPERLGRHAYIVLTATYRLPRLAEQHRLVQLHADFVSKPFELDHLLQVVQAAAMQVMVAGSGASGEDAVG